MIVYGGGRYLASTYVTLRALRHVGCTLPIEVWHIGAAEMPEHARAAFEGLGATCVDVESVRAWRLMHVVGGWQLKSFALLHTRFREVLALDADCYPAGRDPTEVFDWPEYVRERAVFWPDDAWHDISPQKWSMLGLTGTPPWSFESGVIAVDTLECARELALATWVNANASYYWRHFWGDKDSFLIAWRKLGRSYAQPPHRWKLCVHSLLQHDMEGRLMFVHRVRDKFRLPGTTYDNTRQYRRECWFNPSLPLEQECFGWLGEWKNLQLAEEDRELTARVVAAHQFRYIHVGHRCALLALGADGSIVEGGARERTWSVRGGLLTLWGDRGPLAILKHVADGAWCGMWRKKTTVMLVPLGIERRRA